MVFRFIKHALTTRWLEILLTVLVVYSVVRFGWLAVQWPGMIPNDYTMYHATCDRWHAGEEIYRPTDPSPFKYSPTFLVAFCGTLDLVGKHVAWPLFAALSTVIFALVTRLWLGWAQRGDGLPLLRSVMTSPAPWPAAPALITALIFGWHGYLEQYGYGQVDFLLFSALAGAAMLVEKNRPREMLLAATLLSFVLLTKPPMTIMLVYFALASRWNVLVLTGGMTLVLLMAPALGWGWDQHVAMLAAWKNGLAAQTAEFLIGNHNQNLASSITRLIEARKSVLFLTPFFIGVFALAMLIKWSALRSIAALGPGSRARLFGWLVLAYLLVTPLSWRWLTFVWIPIATVILSDAAEALRGRRRHRQIVTATIAAFIIVGLTRQRAIASLFGIAEVDELSFAGFYAWGSLALFIASAFGLTQGPESPPVKR